MEPITPAVVGEIAKRLVDGGVRLVGALNRKQVKIAIMGARATGKTTFANRLAARPITPVHSPTVGGDRSAWAVWERVSTDDRPNGIIFVIDHGDPGEQRAALRHFAGFLGDDTRRWLVLKGARRKARDQVKDHGRVEQDGPVAVLRQRRRTARGAVVPVRGRADRGRTGIAGAARLRVRPGRRHPGRTYPADLVVVPRAG